MCKMIAKRMLQVIEQMKKDFFISVIIEFVGIEDKWFGVEMLI